MFREMPQSGEGNESRDEKQAKLFADLDRLQAIEDTRPLTDTEANELNELRVKIAEFLEQNQ